MPGEDHRIFLGTIQPVDSPFWSQHSPGDRWNCQCSLEQTDKAPTHAVTNNPDGENPAPGLDGNPAEPQLFSNSHPYYPKSCMACPFVSNKLAALYHNLADNRDCNNCKAVNSAIDKTQKYEIIAQNKAQYEVLKKDPNYKDVSFNEKTGGLKASHIEHNFDKKGGKYELNVQEAGYKAGNSVIFGSEKFELENQRFTEGLWNGLPFEVAGRETATENNVLKGLKHCAAKRATKIAVLDFPNGGFDNEVLTKAISRYKGLEKLKDSQYVKFEKIMAHQQNMGDKN